jgi:hypothetical protein
VFPRPEWKRSLVWPIDGSVVLVLYYCFRLRSSWYRYTIRFYTYCMFRPDVAIFRDIGSHITYFFSCYSPYTDQCLHVGSGWYVWFYVMPYVSKRIKYWIFKIWEFWIFEIFKLGLKLILGFLLLLTCPFCQFLLVYASVCVFPVGFFIYSETRMWY